MDPMSRLCVGIIVQAIKDVCNRDETENLQESALDFCLGRTDDARRWRDIVCGMADVPISDLEETATEGFLNDERAAEIKKIISSSSLHNPISCPTNQRST